MKAIGETIISIHMHFSFNLFCNFKKDNESWNEYKIYKENIREVEIRREH